MRIRSSSLCFRGRDGEAGFGECRQCGSVAGSNVASCQCVAKAARRCGILPRAGENDEENVRKVTRQSKRRFVRVNASRGVYSDKGVYLAGSFWGRRCVHGHERPCWRASAAPGSAFKRQGAARGGRFAEAVCQSKRPLPLGRGRAGARPTPRRPGSPLARVSAPPSH